MERSNSVVLSCARRTVISTSRRQQSEEKNEYHHYYESGSNSTGASAATATAHDHGVIEEIAQEQWDGNAQQTTLVVMRRLSDRHLVLSRYNTAISHRIENNAHP